MEIKQPIFIIGAGRSGTTVFYQHLALHPELCWFSNFTNKYPNLDFVANIHRLLDLPIIGKKLKKNILTGKRFTIRPTEAGNIYHQLCNFSHNKKTNEQDLEEVNIDKFLHVIENHLKTFNKQKFLSKQTANTQRLRLLNELFDEALYIHVIRDGRAVANSLYNVKFWKDIDLWWCKDSSKINKENIETCGINWEKNVNEIIENKYLFKERYYELKYEDLCKDFKKEISDVLEFCALKKDNAFLKQMPKTLPNKNYKWKEQLTEEQKIVLENTIKTSLNILGYL